uniref:Uncharacterized protein n=1 Tax=Sphaerodactylus townsendi TaxID=933632 RepID=A0ACB8ENX6_9SAUR
MDCSFSGRDRKWSVHGILLPLVFEWNLPTLPPVTHTWQPVDWHCMQGLGCTFWISPHPPTHPPNLSLCLSISGNSGQLLRHSLLPEISSAEGGLMFSGVNEAYRQAGVGSLRGGGQIKAFLRSLL